MLACAIACAARAACAEPEDPEYKGRATVSAAFASGNAASRRLYADSELTARAPQYRYDFSGKVERRSEPGADSVSIWRAGGNRDHFLDGARFVYARAAAEHDGAKDLDRRLSAGGGYGEDVVATELARLSLRGGLDLVSERRSGEPARDYPALGWALKASHKFPGSKAELFHEHDGLRDLRANAFVVHSRSGVRFPLAAGLNASVQLNVDWESRPAPGRKPTDAVLLFGAGLDW
jgi:hypothetical protein